MDIDENSGAIINLTEAKEFAKQYGGLFPTEIPAYFVGKQKVKDILDQENCMGIKIYKGYDFLKQKKNLIIIGVDNKGAEIPDIIVERALPCPPAGLPNILLL